MFEVRFETKDIDFHNRLRAAYLRAIQWGMIAAAPLTGLMIAVGLPSVVVVLGERWREAGVVVTAMAGVGVGRALQSVSQEAIKGSGRTSLIHWCTAVEVVGGLISGSLALISEDDTSRESVSRRCTLAPSGTG